MPLRYYQREAVDSVFAYWAETPGHPLIDMATGCHAAGTQILMHDGTTKPVELVAANDNVMGPDSRPRRVLSLARGREMMYRVTPTKGDPFVVNEGHILSLKTTNQGAVAVRYPACKTSGGEVKNVRLSDYLVKSANWKHLHKLWRTGVEFPANDNPLPVPAWIIGILLGDGSMTNGVSITNADDAVINEFQEYVEAIGLRCRVRQKPDNIAVSVHASDDNARNTRRNKLVIKLQSAGVYGLRCEEKCVPHAYKTSSRDDRLELLAGIIDTDGSLAGPNSFDFISKSKQLAEDVAFISRSLGFAAYAKVCQKRDQNGRGGSYWRVSISGDTHSIPTRIKRKQALPRLQKKSPLVTSFTVEPIGVGDYYGFALDGDHLYLTGDFTVHHNTGKSMTMATLSKEMLRDYPDIRVACVTHVVELIEGNYLELLGIYPFAPAGIYAASLNQRRASAQILFAQLQTVYNKAAEIGHVDVLLIDEVHLVPARQNTMYRTFIDALLAINPDMKICGFTATPYRLDSGRLDEGDDRLFDKVVYTYGIRAGIDDGYLSPITSTPTSVRQDVSGVGKLGGDFKKSALQAAVDKDELNRRILQEVLDVEGHRRSALFFCAGVAHATHMRDLVLDAGKSCEVIHGGTDPTLRRNLIAALKAGEIWSLTNDNVMSTGTNVPGIDLIVDQAPTASASRYVQRVGRGTRVIYPLGFDPDATDAAGRRAAIAAGPKRDCRYMDFAGNLRRHGPVDMIEPKKPGKGDGDAPIKVCPSCIEELHASVQVCWKCGHQFPAPEPKLNDQASDAPILSTGDARWREVKSRAFRYHEGKGGKPDSVKVAYMCGPNAINEWCCPAHRGRAKANADRYWRRHGGKLPFPKSALEWLERQTELFVTSEIEVEPNGRFWNVLDHRTGDQKQVADNDNDMSADNDNWRGGLSHLSEDDLRAMDDIPF